ncbi:MAG: 7-cyano-7-deazaguanine synthase [Candidatus Lokiarchaeota archaeon]|nr:7-cyano-7-deazaguanine synthase [Candidatus Lokiarchaeota archaeon]
MSKLNFQHRTFVSLLSSGLDSPIATYLMLKKGFDGILLSFKVSNQNDTRFNAKIRKIAHHLKQITNKKLVLYIINHKETLEKFVEQGKRKLTCLFCKSFMLYSASVLAQNLNAEFIVTGDILGEQASQTLTNISAVQNIVNDIPVIRPLVGFEKKDVLKLSHTLGFYELSTLPDIQCTFNPLYPETQADIEEIRNSIQNMNFSSNSQIKLKNAQMIIVE